MTETPETNAKSSTGRKIAATISTLAVTVVIGMASSGITDKINDRIRKQIVKNAE